MRKQPATSQKKSTQKPDPKNRKRVTKASDQSDQTSLVTDFREDTLGLVSHTSSRWSPPEIQLALPHRVRFLDD